MYVGSWLLLSLASRHLRVSLHLDLKIDAALTFETTTPDDDDDDDDGMSSSMFPNAGTDPIQSQVLPDLWHCLVLWLSHDNLSTMLENHRMPAVVWHPKFMAADQNMNDASDSRFGAKKPGSSYLYLLSASTPALRYVYPMEMFAFSVYHRNVRAQLCAIYTGRDDLETRRYLRSVRCGGHELRVVLQQEPDETCLASISPSVDPAPWWDKRCSQHVMKNGQEQAFLAVNQREVF
ncbi:uncharacterized protein PG986_015065 [Apiospora aurea]|uniref:Uncharacterized protein n=1 Tax=Apiospora aurea TaxID=335848 RepID=A0ABR1PRH7_9PEZI